MRRPVLPALLLPLALLAASCSGASSAGEASGTTAADVSGNGRAGTFHGTPTLGQPGPVTVCDPYGLG